MEFLPLYGATYQSIEEFRHLVTAASHHPVADSFLVGNRCPREVIHWAVLQEHFMQKGLVDSQSIPVGHQFMEDGQHFGKERDEIGQLIFADVVQFLHCLRKCDAPYEWCVRMISIFEDLSPGPGSGRHFDFHWI